MKLENQVYIDGFVKRFSEVTKKLHLKDETVDGFDEQAYVRNFIADELSLLKERAINAVPGEMEILERDYPKVENYKIGHNACREQTLTNLKEL